jgi:hypothetical protein
MKPLSNGPKEARIQQYGEFVMKSMGFGTDDNDTGTNGVDPRKGAARHVAGRTNANGREDVFLIFMIRAI